MKNEKTLSHKYLRGRERGCEGDEVGEESTEMEQKKSISIHIKICYFISVMLRVPFCSKHSLELLLIDFIFLLLLSSLSRLRYTIVVYKM